MDRFYTVFFFPFTKINLKTRCLSSFRCVRPSVPERYPPGGSDACWQPGVFPLQFLLLLPEGFPPIHCHQLKLKAKTSCLSLLNLLNVCSHLGDLVDDKDAILMPCWGISVAHRVMLLVFWSFFHVRISSERTGKVGCGCLCVSYPQRAFSALLPLSPDAVLPSVQSGPVL